MSDQSPSCFAATKVIFIHHQWVFPVYRLANIQECPGDQGPSPGGPMVIVHVLTGCLPNMVHGNGCWCDAARMMRLLLSDAAREETLTMILTLGMRARGGPCLCRQTLGRWPIVCQCAGVRTVGERKRKYCFWLGQGSGAGVGMDWAGGHFSKSSSFWILGSMKGKWRVMKSYR